MHDVRSDDYSGGIMNTHRTTRSTQCNSSAVPLVSASISSSYTSSGDAKQCGCEREFVRERYCRRLYFIARKSARVHDPYLNLAISLTI